MIIEGRLFDDVWWGKAEPISITAYRRTSSDARDARLRFAKGQVDSKVGIIRNIRFNNIICKSENGVFLSGEENKIMNILFENISLEIDKTTQFMGAQYDKRPCAGEGIIKERTSGFYLRNAHNVTLRNCRIIWGNNKPDYFGYALASKNVTDLKI